MLPSHPVLDGADYQKIDSYRGPTWPVDPKKQGCAATSQEDRQCCTDTGPCGEWEGDCDGHHECAGDLVCGTDNACEQSFFR